MTITADKNQLKVLHFLADGRVGGPQVRIVRIHAAMNDIGCKIETSVACPLPQPVDYFVRPEMRHVLIEWHKPSADRPLRSGVTWLFSGLWKDLVVCRKILRQFSDAVVHVNGAILLSAAIASALEHRAWVWHLNDTSAPRFLALAVRALLFIGRGQPVASSGAVVNYYGLSGKTKILYPPVVSSVTKDHVDYPIGGIKLGVMANLSPGKGIEDIIEAFAIAQKTRPDIRLLIAGRVLENKRWYFEAMQQRVRELGIADKVEFSGFVSDPLAWMHGIDLFVFSSYSEAAGLSLIEAMASGLPIILADVPATREILGGCGVLTPLGDVRAMAHAIVELVENPELRRVLGEKASSRGGSVFSIDAIARKHCELYSKLLRGR